MTRVTDHEPADPVRLWRARRLADERVMQAITELDRELSHVLEPAMQRCLVYEAVVAASDDDFFDLVRVVLGRRPSPPSGPDPLRDALYALLTTTGEAPALAYERRASLYARAVDAGDETLLRILRSQAPSAVLERPEARLPKELADIPLGRRRSLAKAGTGPLLEGLTRDPDPLVIRNLLRNPRLREEDVVRIAALRPVAASTLVEIERCTRWKPRPRVRAALARNPFCPPALALQLVRGLAQADLRELCRDPDLHPETLEQARAELSLRAGRPRR